MGTFFQQNFCIFSARWVSILKKNSVFVEQDGTHLQESFCSLFHKVAAFTRKISVYFYMMSIFSKDLL